MNPYIDTIDSSEERTRLRNVNRLAVNRSKETGDLENAARYAQAGIKLLPENAWTDQSLMEEAMFFYLARGECAFAIARSGSGNFDAPMQSIQQVSFAICCDYRLRSAYIGIGYRQYKLLSCEDYRL